MMQIENDLFDRRQIEQSIKDYLISFDENCKNIQFKKGLYIYGHPGCGKTNFITQILKDLDYDIIKFDAGDVRNKALIESITSNNISNQNVLTMMARKKKKIAIIMDEIDGMNNGDKGGISSLIKMIRQKKTKKQRLEHQTLNPVICIGNYYMDKKIRELMKVCNVYELQKPTDAQITYILNKQYNIALSKIPDLVSYIQGDLRKLEFIDRVHKKNPEFLIQNMNTIFQLKSYNEDSKNITHKLLTNHYPLSSHTRILNDTDRTIVALLWHENIVDAISKQDKKKSFPFYLKILENICYADYVDRITFQNQIWQFNEMSSIIKTFYNNSLYHEHFPDNSIQFDEIRFTKVLTKYSTEYNNILFVYNLCQQLDLDKKDLLAFFQEMRLFFGNTFMEKHDTLENVEKIFEHYEIDKLDIKRIYRYLDKNVKIINNNIIDDDDE